MSEVNLRKEGLISLKNRLSSITDELNVVVRELQSALFDVIKSLPTEKKENKELRAVVEEMYGKEFDDEIESTHKHEGETS